MRVHTPSFAVGAIAPTERVAPPDQVREEHSSRADPGVVVEISDRARAGHTGVPDDDGSTAYDDVELLRLRATDRTVRDSGAAKLAVAGHLARGHRVDYRVGPDGHPYAVGSDVDVDTSPGPTPQQTLERAARVRRAALVGGASLDALGDVVAASRMLSSARLELARSRLDEARRAATPERPDETAGERDARDQLAAEQEARRAEEQVRAEAADDARIEAEQAAR